MKNLPLIALVFLITFNHNSQSQSITWMKSFGGPKEDILYDATIDQSGTIYMCGAFRDSIDIDPGEEEYYIISSGGSNAYIVKLDSDGELLNPISIGGTGGSRAKLIRVDENLNYYVTGTFSHTIDVDPGPDTLFFTSNYYVHDIFFQKFNDANQLLWAFQLVTNYEDDKINDIAIDDAGNIYCTGSFSGTKDFDPGESVYELTASGLMDLFILKLDSNGNFLWAKRFGGWYDTKGNSILVDRFGSIIIAGSFKGEVDFDPGPDTVFLASMGVLDAFFLKLTTEGEFQWVKQIGGGANDYISLAKIDNEDNIIVAGSFRMQADFDPDPDEEYIVEGGVWNEFYLLKIDKDGQFNWVITLGNEESIFLHTFDIDSLNNIYFTCVFEETIDIIPGDSTYLIEPVGDYDFFIEKIKANGEFESALVMGSEYQEYSRSILVDKFANVFTIGTFSGNPEYQLNNTYANVSSVGLVDVFIQKISQESIGITEYSEFNLTAYPNPNNGCFTLHSTDIVEEEFHLRIINLLGQSVYEKEVKTPGILNEVVHLDETGTYILEISYNNNLRIIKKIIVNNL